MGSGAGGTFECWMGLKVVDTVGVRGLWEHLNDIFSSSSDGHELSQWLLTYLFGWY